MVLLDQEKINHLPAITSSVVLPTSGSLVSGLRCGSRLMDYDLGPLRETETLVTSAQMEYSRPQL